MSANILRYFAGGNTAKGFYNLYDSNLAGLERVFILSGKSKVEKSNIIERLVTKWEDGPYPLEIIHRASDPERVEGFIIRQLGVAVLDGDHPSVVGEEFVGSQWETIDLDQNQLPARLDEKADIIHDLKTKMERAFNNAYAAYAEGLRVHDDWEDIYIGKMDFNKANEVTNRLIAHILPKANKRNEPATSTDLLIKRRFLGAATPAGPVDFVDNITEGLGKRFFLKGRAGTGKSTLLKKIAAEAKEQGYETEVYHCGFAPESLDMVLVRELGWAVFDSTSPHEYFPSRPNDEIVDMYELTVAPGTDEAFAEEIAKIEAKYRENMAEAKSFLQEAKGFQDQLEEIYREVTDSSHLDEIYQGLDSEIQIIADNAEQK
ncbi:MAG TPA: hypothetical protein VKZ77_07630 [Bacillaceae bacterium]|nr:hypothetical protein [Bacillaceae bacterium]